MIGLFVRFLLFTRMVGASVGIVTITENYRVKVIELPVNLFVFFR